MSYATSLQMAYPPPYGPSTLLSDDLVQRPSLKRFYEPTVPYTSGSRLHSDTLTGLHRPSVYSHLPPTDWHSDLLPRYSFVSFNNIREYSESLRSTSGMARSIDDNNANIFPNYQQNYSRLLNDVDRGSHLSAIWSPTRPKIPINDSKPTPTYRSLPEISAQKKSSIEETNPTIVENDKKRSSVDIHAWLSETKTESPVDEKVAEEAWTVKIDQLHTIQAQREKEKEKAKSSRVLPSVTKKIENKSTINDKKTRIISFPTRNDSYFDTLFDGNFFRKTSTNQQKLSPSYQRNKSTTQSLNKAKPTVYPKYVPTRKVSQYDPPTTTASKKQGPKQVGSVSSRENIHKDKDERFHEALQKFREDRAEQQRAETNESTAKRLQYGDYVRHSTKDDLLQNAIKPLPWADFMDTKYGSVYSLTKEEKKDLCNQSKSYGERVRYRNYALHNGDEPSRTHHYATHFLDSNKESQSDDETVNNDSKSDSNSTIKTTNKTYTKQTSRNDIISNQSSRTTKLTDRSSSAIRPSEDDDEDVSDFEYRRKQKKNVYNSSVPTTSGTEESENDQTNGQRNIRMKYRDTNDDLFTVREEKTFQPLKSARYKKR